MKFPLYAHQLEAIEKAKGQKTFAYFAEMGVGKSVMLLAEAERLYNEMEIDCLFILAPKGVYKNWSNKEIPQHLSIPYEVYTWSASLTEKQESTLHWDVLRTTYKLKIVLVNIESLISKRAFKFSLKVLSSLRGMLAIDESTMIKNPTSQRTKATLELGPLAKYRRIMTGSPITKSPYDLYAQALFLDEKLLGFSSFLNYRHYYAIIEKGYGNSMVMRWNPETKKREMMRVTFEKVVGYKNLDQLNARIQPWSFRKEKKDCLDLPDKVYITRDVELTPEQIKAYNSMKEQWTMEVVQGSVTASISLTKSLKMHQILCGHVKNDDGEMLHIPTKRVEALMQVLEECQDQKIIIWANYRQDIILIREAIEKVYGKEALVEFHGGTSDSDRKDAVESFQTKDSTHFFLGTTRTAGRGITLTKATLVIFYSYDYDLELRLQAEDRAHRIGMQDKLTILDLKVPDSIDETILACHKSKALVAEEILRQVRELPEL